MKPFDVTQFFNKHPQFDRPEWQALIRPCIKIAFGVNHATDGSRWGGTPFLPQDFKLPKTDLGGEYRFLGQLNFGDFSQLNTPVMPKTGLLSLFFNNDDDAFWGLMAMFGVIILPILLILSCMRIKEQVGRWV